MSFKRWFLSFFTEKNRIYCEYNIDNESFYLYEFGGKIKTISLNNLLTKQIRNNDDKKLFNFLLETVLFEINKLIKNYDKS